MNVNGVTGVDAYSSYKASADYSKKEDPGKSSSVDNSVAAVYERSSTGEEATSSASKKTYVPNEELIAKMKADAEERTAQLKSLVEKIILKQAEKGSNIFDFLGQEYSAEDIAKAKEDVSEDGYWGVKQTSQRILDFAVALTGGDPDKIDEMKAAFEKGYKTAEKTWGGELPDLCKQTFDAVLAGFDKMAEEAGSK
ncbi:MAG: hypothetical protein K6A38_00120 [Lachnospiraceae bacterium]|nr:hypothetical protein [Lachnospiraceae bacterium]